MSIWNPDREMPMLEALLAGKKLWKIGATLRERKTEMHKIHECIKEEHQYMLDHEPQDQFHACVLLGALNLIGGLLDDLEVRLLALPGQSPSSSALTVRAIRNVLYPGGDMDHEWSCDELDEIANILKDAELADH